MEVIDYKIVYSFETVDAVMDDVKDLLKNGWQPFGSLKIDTFADSNVYLQTMVKYKGEKQNDK